MNYRKFSLYQGIAEFTIVEIFANTAIQPARLFDLYNPHIVQHRLVDFDIHILIGRF